MTRLDARHRIFAVLSDLQPPGHRAAGVKRSKCTLRRRIPSSRSTGRVLSMHHRAPQR
jgi:hypothetical protein